MIHIKLPVKLIGDENQRCVATDDTELTVDLTSAGEPRS